MFSFITSLTKSVVFVMVERYADELP